MNSISFNSTNNMSESNSNKNSSFNPSKIPNTISTKKDSNSLEHFKAFSSALFMSEYQENDDTLISSNSNSNKDQKDKYILDNIKFSPSLEKCLTNELLESIADDSSNIKNSDIKNKNIINMNDNLKITKKLFQQENAGDNINKNKNKNDIINNDININMKDNDCDKNTLYEESINGFEYQLKFIENSVHNILPKSYKKFDKNNNYFHNKNYQRNYFPYRNNKNTCDGYYNNYYYSKNKKEKNNFQNNDNNNNNINEQLFLQVQRLKENNYEDWKCNYCSFLNRGYRKLCAKCRNYKKQ